MHRTILRRTAAFAITAVALSACSADAPVAPQPEPVAHFAATAPTPTSSIQLSREEATVPFYFVQYVPCANGGQGEVVSVEGELSYRGQWTATNDGQRYHSVLVERFVGDAKGWETGEEFDVTLRAVSQGNTTDGDDGILDSGEELQRMQVRLTSRLTGAVVQIELTGHFVETPAGDYVLGDWTATWQCR